VSCRQYAEAISAYLDGETAAEEHAGLQRHVASCTECSEHLEGFRALKHAVARLEGRSSPPEPVQARIEALRFRLRPRGRWLRRFGLAAAVGAAALAVATLGRDWLRIRPHASLPEELIADHLRYVPEAMPAEVASGDADEVRRFFVGRVPFEPVVPRLGAARLIGGRVCKIEGHKVQLLFYEIVGRKLSLYVSDREAKMEACHSGGEHCVCGKRLGALSLMLVGRAPERELRELLNEAVL
jgi:anti-sigma factor RsiW